MDNLKRTFAKENDSKPSCLGKKGKELWYPTYAPHFILGTNKSILDETNRYISGFLFNI